MPQDLAEVKDGGVSRVELDQRRSRLGSNRVFATPDQKDLTEDLLSFSPLEERETNKWRKRAYAAQRAIAKHSLVDSANVSSCSWKLVLEAVNGSPYAHVDMAVGKDGKKSVRIGNVMTCKSNWACPVCRLRSVVKKSQEMQKIVQMWRSFGKSVSLITLTIPHTRGDSLEETLNCVIDSWRAMQKGKGWNLLNLDIFTKFKAIEVTWGPKSGWHPHVHFLVLHNSKLPDGYAAKMKTRLFRRWKAQVTDKERASRLSTKYAVHVAENVDNGWYLAKAGIGHEMSSVAKQGKAGRFSIDELENFLLDPGQSTIRFGTVKDVLQEFYAATKGKVGLNFPRDQYGRIVIDAVRNSSEIDNLQYRTYGYITQAGMMGIANHINGQDALRGMFIKSGWDGVEIVISGIMGSQDHCFRTKEMIEMDLQTNSWNLHDDESPPKIGAKTG